MLIDVLEGAMMVLAMYTLNIAHPGFLLADLQKDDKKKDEEKTQEGAGPGDLEEEKKESVTLSTEVDGVERRRRTPIITQSMELEGEC